MGETKRYFVARAIRVPGPLLEEGSTVDLDPSVAEQYVRDGSLNEVPDQDAEAKATADADAAAAAQAEADKQTAEDAAAAEKADAEAKATADADTAAADAPAKDGE